ncbi:flavoprotein [Porcipelethomonas sp.]|uniref:flavoprotein n=1 Tax=Porcipelethomonas sp. TaxID=2981675 RepID=UPI003EF150E8
MSIYIFCFYSTSGNVYNNIIGFRFIITDTPVTMAVKSHIRNARPAVIALASNDSLAGSMKNIGYLMNMKNYYFVPIYQDDYANKPTSAICDFSRLEETIKAALAGKQIQPVLC